LAGNTAVNNPIEISTITLEDTNTACSGTASEAQQGSFNIGYNYSFETIGTDVKITFELLDDKDGVFAYLWKESPFTETVMTQVSGNIFTYTLTDQTINTSISYGCKFAFAGGLAVTKYFSYTVGDLCSSISDDDDQDGVRNEFDSCPNTALGTDVDANGCELLSSDNFTLKVVSETCVDKDNGQLTIESINKDYTFTATLNGTKHEFSDTKTFENLEPGDYEVCIEVSNVTAAYCFSFSIEEGTDTSAKASTTKNKTSVEMLSGTAPYNVFINGQSVLKTMSNSFEVETKHGDLVEVKTAVVCEGVFQKTVELFDDITLYPNPTEGIAVIALPMELNKVVIEIYNNTAQLLSKNEFDVIRGNVQLDLSNFATGIYKIRILLDKPVSLSIIKQ
jgi:hypothetical protein